MTLNRETQQLHIAYCILQQYAICSHTAKEGTSSVHHPPALLLNFISWQFQNSFNHSHLVPLIIILIRAVAYNAQGFHNDHLANDDLLNAHTTRTMPHNTCAVRTYHSTPRPCNALLLLQHYIQFALESGKMHCVPMH